MTRQAPRNEENRVDADRVAGPGKARREALGGGRHPAQAIFVERHRRCVLGGALLDLDEGERTPAPRDQINLAAGNPRAPGEDAPAVESEPPGGDGFGAAAARFGGRAFQSPPPSVSARA